MLAMGVRVEQSELKKIPLERYFAPTCFYSNGLRGLSYEGGPISRRASLQLNWIVI